MIDLACSKPRQGYGLRPPGAAIGEQPHSPFPAARTRRYPLLSLAWQDTQTTPLRCGAVSGPGCPGRLSKDHATLSARACCRSTGTPGPIVGARVIERTNWPRAPDGRAFWTASTTEAMLSSRAFGAKSVFPMGT